MKLDHFPRRNNPWYTEREQSGRRSETNMDAKTDESAGKCPVIPTARTNRDWWPNQLNLSVLHQNSSLSDPMGKEFDYVKEFKSLDLNAVVKDLHALMTAMVAGRLWPLRAAVHSNGVAQRGPLPYRRWARWGRRRPAALCAAQQLAG